MQASSYLAPPLPLPPITATKFLALPCRPMPRLQTSRCTAIRKTGDPSAVDYSSTTSVFPAEACETVGGEACDAEIYPEVKIKPEAKSNTARTSSEAVEREYFEYNEPKTVFPAEACDDLGGEFCEPDYQKGVY